MSIVPFWDLQRITDLFSVWANGACKEILANVNQYQISGTVFRITQDYRIGFWQISYETSRFVKISSR